MILTIDQGTQIIVGHCRAGQFVLAGQIYTSFFQNEVDTSKIQERVISCMATYDVDHDQALRFINQMELSASQKTEA